MFGSRREDMLAKRLFVPVLVTGAALAYAHYRRRDLGGLWGNVRRYSAPSAALYDAVATATLGSFYVRVAQDVATLAPRARVLEVGSGPGRLAIKLVQLAPDSHITGVDITPAMVARATALSAKSGLADRAEFLVGDVAALPFPDAAFDVVVSTFSLHHWSRPSQGLAEIHRVLCPGGVARIYDVADWIRRLEQRGPDIAEVAQNSPFAGHGACTTRVITRLGPIPLVYLAELRRD
jgi:SAM-dependent methyltransferase